MNTESKCNLPPSGWSCTRTAGHDGPCAAIADSDRVAADHAMKASRLLRAGSSGQLTMCACRTDAVDSSLCDCKSGTVLAPAPTTAQQRFDAMYISSLEIAERLQVSRPAVLHARKRGILPDPVCVNDGQIYVWERKEVEPYLAAWELSVKLRRGQQVVIPLRPASAAQAAVLGVPFLEPLRSDE